MEERYQRHIVLDEIGKEGQEKLLSASVAVIGAGGLGCPILQYLVAAGVGRIGIFDGDQVSISNLQRQVLYTTNDVGLSKADCAKRHLEELNSDVVIHAIPQMLDQSNISQLEEYDIVVDGTDQIHMRYLLNDICSIWGKPLVFGAIHKFEGQVSVFHYKGKGNYRDLFPTPPSAQSMPSCNDVGVLGVLPGMIGVAQANEVLKIILGIGEVLSEKLWIYNALKSQVETIQFSSSKSNNAPSTIEAFMRLDYQSFCGARLDLELSWIEAMELVNDGAVYLDIREMHEQPKLPFSHEVIQTTNMEELLDQQKIMVFCQHGVRSLHFVQHMRNEGYVNTFSVRGGIVALKNELNEV